MGGGGGGPWNTPIGPRRNSRADVDAVTMVNGKWSGVEKWWVLVKVV